MPEVVIKYKDKKTLEVFRDLAKYFGYEVASPDPSEKNKEQVDINGVTIIPGIALLILPNSPKSLQVKI